MGKLYDEKSLILLDRSGQLLLYKNYIIIEQK